MSGEKEIQKAYESLLGQHFQEAVEWFHKAIEQDPNNPEYHYKLSITYARSSRLEDAMRHGRTALQLQPDKEEYAAHVKALQSRLYCQAAERMMEQDERGNRLAIACLREALRLNPLEERAYVLLAAANAQLEEYQDAISSLQTLLEMDPHHETAQTLYRKYKRLLADYMEEKK